MARYALKGQYEQMDWAYVGQRLRETDEPRTMSAIDRRIRSRARRELTKRRLDARLYRDGVRTDI